METYLHCPSEVNARKGFALQKFTLQRTQLLPHTKQDKSLVHKGKQEGYWRCRRGTWSVWVIKQMWRTFHRHDKRRSSDGVCSSSPRRPDSRIQMLRKPRMCKLYSFRIIRRLFLAPLGTFKCVGVSTLSRWQRKQSLISETSTWWCVSPVFWVLNDWQSCWPGSRRQNKNARHPDTAVGYLFRFI